MNDEKFDEMVRRATSGIPPYPYQTRIAMGGLPEVLAVPTGAGKTLAAVLPWLYRRRFHSSESVRRSTPRRLVYVLPMRTLVEQSVASIESWLRALDLDRDLRCHVLMGGEPRLAEWRIKPDQDAIIVGTLDMILSRALNRGYGESRYLWPIDFGLLNADCQFVYDEVQLMGPALATSRQLHGLRQKLGTALPCRSMWMSATVDEGALATFDAPTFDEPMSLDVTDRANAALDKRLHASKLVHEIQTDGWVKLESDLAAFAVSQHRPGTLTLIVVNTVDRAVAVHQAIDRMRATTEAVLVHSRFRPRDRRAVVDRVKAEIDPTGPGRIVVSTQVIEAGLDISATNLITEAAPWPSIVQRAGRCNRDGGAIDARLMWLAPVKPEPYEVSDIEATCHALAGFEGQGVTAESLRAAVVPVRDVIQPTLRRRDLLDLFDTMADLSGNDIDIARFIRDSSDMDVFVAWRPNAKASADKDRQMPGTDERCPVPIGKFRDWLKKPRAPGLSPLRWDHVVARWVECGGADLRPGMVVIVDSKLGGYEAHLGWSPSSSTLVEPVEVGADQLAADDQSTEDDPASIGLHWVTLRDHLADTEREARGLLGLLQPPGLSSGQCTAIIDAARLHDIGKAHPVFRDSIAATMLTGQSRPPEGLVLAKSAGTGRLRHRVKNFRHELASALALLGEGQVALVGVEETDLTVYLVAAHHGRVRIGLRSLPGDERPQKASAVLGIEGGDELPTIELPVGELPASTLDLGYVGLGRRDGKVSWSERALALRDRDDIGPFRLGFMEAVVRLADWEASKRPTVWIPEGEVSNA